MAAGERAVVTGSEPSAARPRRVCDYEGSDYRRAFWEAGAREYEDLADRLALRCLLPARGQRLLDVGAGFGRLAPEYGGYREVVLLDYAFSMLSDARAHFGDRFRYACADVYRLPIATSSVDSVVMIRVLHHLEDPEAALREIARCLCPGGSLILEFANKRHAKAILRYLFRRTASCPFDEGAVEFAPLHWVFHPRAVERALEAAGLAIRERRSASFLRSPILKRRIPARVLLAFDRLMGARLARLALAPSQYVRAVRLTGTVSPDGLWRCPACGAEPMTEVGGSLGCFDCGRQWSVRNGIYLLREGMQT